MDKGRPENVTPSYCLNPKKQTYELSPSNPPNRSKNQQLGKLENGQRIGIARPYTGSACRSSKDVLSLLVLLRHENLLKLIGYYIKEATPFFVFELAAKGSLDRFIRGTNFHLKYTSPFSHANCHYMFRDTANDYYWENMMKFI
ncbi:hypothetical protein R6Q59_013092 [Mikania micrantha]